MFINSSSVCVGGGCGGGREGEGEGGGEGMQQIVNNYSVAAAQGSNFVKFCLLPSCP